MARSRRTSTSMSSGKSHDVVRMGGAKECLGAWLEGVLRGDEGMIL
jgi:hypothetical protein